MALEFGPALGVSTADFNGDGWMDTYVANDGQPNLLWMNQRNGTFKNVGLLSGTALSAHGKAKAGISVDAGDVDNDSDEELVRHQLHWRRAWPKVRERDIVDENRRAAERTVT